MKIQVKKKHIDKGGRANCNLCPIALAIKEATGVKHVAVDFANYQAVAYIYKDPHEYPKVVKINDEASWFMVKFDRTGIGHPFEFEIDY